MSDLLSDDEVEKTIADDLVVTKYKMGGDMANLILKELLPKCTQGASVRELCILGDKMITEKTSSVFKKEKELTKGANIIWFGYFDLGFYFWFGLY